MATIFKYALEINDTQIVKLPTGYKILTIQTQRGFPCMWAIVPTPDGNPITTEDVKLHTFGTGHPFPDGAEHLEYIASYQVMNEQQIYHVFVESD